MIIIKNINKTLIETETEIYNILCNYNYCLKMLNSNNKQQIENMSKFYLNL